MIRRVECPHCGETNTIHIDSSGGGHQRYVEDCQVCCNPWEVSVTVDDDVVDVVVRSLDD